MAENESYNTNQSKVDAVIPSTEEVPTNDNTHILYITLAIIVGLFLLWFLIIFFTKENPIQVLDAMKNAASQIATVSDAGVKNNVPADPVQTQGLNASNADIPN